MPPEPEAKPTDDSEDANGEDAMPIVHDLDTDRIEGLRTILTETKIRHLQQILASETRALSAPELAARNDVTSSTIRDHLRSRCQRRCRPWGQRA